MGDFDLKSLIWFGMFVILVVWGCWELIDWIWIDDVIRTTTPIVPDIELVVKDNVIDTIYVYRLP